MCGKQNENTVTNETRFGFLEVSAGCDCFFNISSYSYKVINKLAGYHCATIPRENSFVLRE